MAGRLVGHFPSLSIKAREPLIDIATWLTGGHDCSTVNDAKSPNKSGNTPTGADLSHNPMPLGQRRGSAFRCQSKIVGSVSRFRLLEAPSERAF